MHYGVKGMKWDPSKRRRRGQTDPTGGAKAKMTISDAYEDKKTVKSTLSKYRKMNTLSDKRLAQISNNQLATDSKTNKHGQTIRDMADNLIEFRKNGETKRHRDGSGVTDVIDKVIEKKKKKSFTGIAKKASRKLEKRRNKERTNARKAEQAYRRGGH
jgi:CHASE3 domain sensor protein